MRVGYARTSTIDQQAGLDAQLVELQDKGCEKIFQEQVSSVDRDARTQLDAAIEFCREMDTLVCTKLDRLARSVPHLLQIIDRLAAKGVGVEIGNLGRLDNTATGKLMVTMLGAIAALEREIMLERQKEGIKKAQKEGKYRGRAPTARRQTDEVIRLLGEGLKKTEIARRLNMHVASVHRILKEAKVETTVIVSRKAA